MAKKPEISVLIAAYNRENYIATALKSILNQTKTDFEVIVVDDGSTDSTMSVVQSYPDPRIRLIRNERNLGIPRTRNRGLEAARGQYFAILDSDDYALPHRLARQAAFLGANPDIAEVGAWGGWMDATGRMNSKVKQQPLTDGAIRTQLLFTCCINNRSLMARTEVLRQFGYPTDFTLSSDYELHRKVVREHKVANLPEVLVVGRAHNAQATKINTKLQRMTTRAVVRNLLQDIGLSVSETDLDRHLALWKPHTENVPHDLDFLAWSWDWIDVLRDAIPAHYREIDRILGRICLANLWRAWSNGHIPKKRILSHWNSHLALMGISEYGRRALAKRRSRADLFKHTDPSLQLSAESDR